MTASVGWLDTSAEEQRATREMIALFTQSESRDELGIGQIRDAFSDLLFPGTSVLQTRARYFLIVPWLFVDGARRGRSGRQLIEWVEARERRLIDVLRREGHTDGLIGRIAGPDVKVLPSTIYWTGLVRYGVLRRDVASDRLGAPPTDDETDGELTERRRGDWHPTLPPPPPEFPARLEAGFDLTADEASWLGERMRATAAGRLLEHMIASEIPVDPSSPTPWDDPAARAVTGDAARVLRHAELFSLAMQGAALLYNLLLGEEYERSGFTRVQDPVELFRDRLEQWAVECGASAPVLTAWDLDDLWRLVLGENPRVGHTTRLFTRAWIAAVADGRAAAAADDLGLRALVRDRELAQKRGQARLSNPGLLRTWSGEAGTGRLLYRWGTARRLVTDLREGLERRAGT